MLRGQTSTGTRNIHMQLSDRVGRILSSKGLYEIRNFSFVSPKLVEKLGLAADDPRINQLKLTNPLGEDTSVMRSTLVPVSYTHLAQTKIADLTAQLAALRKQTAEYYDSLKKITDAQTASMEQIKRLL